MRALEISTDRLPLGVHTMPGCHKIHLREWGGGESDDMVLGHKLFLKILILVSYNVVASWIVVLSTKSQIMEQAHIQDCF